MKLIEWERKKERKSIHQVRESWIKDSKKSINKKKSYHNQIKNQKYINMKK